MVAIIMSIPPLLVALLSLRSISKSRQAIQEVHLSINSRMTELLDATKVANRAEGKEAGKIEEREEVAQRVTK